MKQKIGVELIQSVSDKSDDAMFEASYIQMEELGTGSSSSVYRAIQKQTGRSRRAAACGRAELLAKSAHAGHLRLPAELLEVAENSGNSKGSEFGISEKCCILEKSRKNLVIKNLATFQQNSGKICGIFHKN